MKMGDFFFGYFNSSAKKFHAACIFICVAGRKKINQRVYYAFWKTAGTLNSV